MAMGGGGLWGGVREGVLGGMSLERVKRATTKFEGCIEGEVAGIVLQPCSSCCLPHQLSNNILS